MRKLFRLSLAAFAGLALAGGAAAQTPWSGIVAENACAAAVIPGNFGGELYAFKVTTGGVYSDVAFDLRQKGGNRTGTADVGSSGPAWSVPPVWREPEAPTDVVFSYITFNDGRIYVNSGELGATAGAATAANVQTMGNTLPPWPGTSGTDMSPDTLGADTGLDFRWGAVAEVNDSSPAASCHIAGLHPDPNTGAGLIAGYNIYRVVDTGSAPTAADLMGNFAYFVPVIGALDLACADGGGPGSPCDLADDLGGIQNGDATQYSGDEVLYFQDTDNTPGGAVAVRAQAAAALGTQYWYAAQPVINTNGAAIGSFDGTTLTSGASFTMTASDATGDGTNDSLDIDGDGSIDFYSPQADFGFGGLGLTNNSLPFVSAPVLGGLDPAAAPGAVRFEGELDGGDVNIAFSSALEQGNVLGFNVYRHHGDVRIPVNEQPILASGGEGSVYNLVDDLGQMSRRLRRAQSLTYSVDVLYNDGSPATTVGPFTVDLTGRDADRAAPARRSR